MSNIIDGRAIAREIITYLKTLPHPKKKMVAFLVGGDPSSLSFLKKKEEVARELNIPFTLYQYKDETEESVLESFSSICSDENVGGVILQLPLPESFNREKFFSLLPPKKDVDNLARKSSVLAPAVLTVKEIIRKTGTKISDKVVAVIGKGLLIGAPISNWLKNQCAELLVFDRVTGLQDLSRADLIISGVGQSGLIKSEEIKPGAGIIDFGYSLTAQGKISGDFDVSSLSGEKRIVWYTPTPHGTGPILVAELFKNFFDLNK